ncbi:MAG: hypothetical protein H6719_02515 [Sandaracinaceae bacterium]|nr:hypothetical protein [Sandaracinaceae bacterium]
MTARVLALACASLLCACAVERVAVDGECIRNSDCRDVLACAAGRCRPECVADRDCDPGLRCLPAGTLGLRACLLPEQPALCAVNSECPEASLCVAGRCRAECLGDADCGGASRCDPSSHTCEQPIDRGADAGPPPDAEVGACEDGGVACGGRCVDLYSAHDHCGACGNACPTVESCVDALCVCATPGAICGGVCVDLETSASSCGACGAACDGPCNEATCCGAGRMSCGGACVDIEGDVAHCGDCETTCAADEACRGGACVAVNDRCEDAVDVSLSATGPTVIEGATRHATDARSSCHNGPNVFYAFTLAERELTWTHVVGPDAYVGYLDRCDVSGVVCPAALCPTEGAGDAWRVLEPGRHVLAVNSNGGFTATIHHVPVGALDATPLPPGAFDVAGALDAASGPATTCASGAERAHFFVTCPADPGGALAASTCSGATYETTLRHATSVGGSVCATSGSCALGADLSATLEPGAALHVLWVGAAAAGTGGPYRLTGSRP